MVKTLNEKPNGDYIEIFCSDWNKDYWAFFAYISKKDYISDIRKINNKIRELNYRDGDIYIELINRSEGLKDFYHAVLSDSNLSDYDILWNDTWLKAGIKMEITREKWDKLNKDYKLKKNDCCMILLLDEQERTILAPVEVI